MNRILFAVVLSLFPLLAFANYEGCQTLAAVAGAGALARDSGTPQSEHFVDVLKWVKELNVKFTAQEREFVIGLAMVAYQVPEQSRADIEREVFVTCMSDQ
jgi:hypothetical protein